MNHPCYRHFEEARRIPSVKLLCINRDDEAIHPDHYQATISVTVIARRPAVYLR